MSIFNTERPVTATESLNRMIKLQNRRKQNLSSALEAMENEIKAGELKKELDNIDKEDEMKAEKQTAINNQQTRRANMLRKQSMSTLENRLFNEGRDELFNQVLFEMVYNAYWLDDAVKESSDIGAMYNSFLSIKDKVAGVITESDTKFISGLRSVVTEAAKKASKRIASEVSDNENPDKISFQLNDSEDIELDNNITDLGKDEIEKLVKDKVLSVVQDEKRAANEKEQYFKEMEDTLTAMDEELAAMNNEGTPEGEVGTTNESVQILRRNINKKMQRATGTSLFECIMMNSTKECKEDIATEGLEVTQEALANAVFTNSIFTYTVLETFNTIGLYKFDAINTPKIMNLFK